jgi:hypothetical protein
MTRMTRMTRLTQLTQMTRWPLLGFVTIAWLTWPACGYSLAGRGNFLPAYIKIIGIPPFVNHSSVPSIDQILTESTVQEFISRGRHVQPATAGADAILTVTVVSVVTSPLAFTPTSRQVSRVQIVVTADVEFRDAHADKVLWANKSVQVRDEYDVSSTTNPNDAGAFLSGDANARQRLAKTFAQQVVTSILEAF